MSILTRQLMTRNSVNDDSLFQRRLATLSTTSRVSLKYFSKTIRFNNGSWYSIFVWRLNF